MFIEQLQYILIASAWTVFGVGLLMGILAIVHMITAIRSL